MAALVGILPVYFAGRKSVIAMTSHLCCLFRVNQLNLTLTPATVDVTGTAVTVAGSKISILIVLTASARYS